jgi:hypothetical protein
MGRGFGNRAAIYLHQLEPKQMKAVLARVNLPDFGMPLGPPEMSGRVYASRLASLIDRVGASGLQILLIYADREHSANLAWLTGFDPRFEEALLILLPGRTPALFVGPENFGFAATARIDLSVVPYPPFGLMGQDRSRTPPLVDLLRDQGVAAGMTIGIAGWKYYGEAESPSAATWSEAPSFIVDTLRAIAGPSGSVVNAGALFMHPTTGLRAVNEIDQLAAFEFASCHTSQAVKNVLFGVQPGMSEFEAAQLLAPVGLPLSCHPMLTAGPHAALGLGSPGPRRMERGDPFTVAYGVWGALTCRAGWLVANAGELPIAVRDYVDKLAAPYFLAVADWYETVGIGVTGGALDAVIRRHLGDPFFGLFLPPGHLIHLDEWMNTPIYPGSEERLVSGQALQVDIIPATGTPYFTANMEDGIALLDARGRVEFAERHPAAWQRIGKRRTFMEDLLGIRLKPEVLPFSQIPAYLPPFILAPEMALVRDP